MKWDVGVFLEYLAKAKRCSPNTLSAYHNDLQQLLDYVGVKKLKGMAQSNEMLLQEYLLHLREKRYSAATTARKIASARSFFKFMVNSGKLGENPAKNLVSPQVSKHSATFLSPLEYHRLVAEPAKLSSPEAKRDIVMLELLYATGLRVSELVALNVHDIDLNNCCIRVANKHSPFDHTISQLLEDFLRQDRLDLLYNESEKALFLNRRGGRLTRQGFWQIVKNYAARAGLSSKVTPHTLRHSFALQKLRNGADLQQVQHLLGHAHISSTRIYKQIQSFSR